MNSGSAITGTFISDLTLYGDIRDLSTESYKYFAGEDADKILLTMSAVGFATSIPAIAAWIGAAKTGGIGAPAALAPTAIDNSISIIKTSYKLRKLSKNLTAHVARISNDAIDFTKLKQSFGSLSSVAKMPSSTQIMSALRRVDVKDVANGKTDEITKVFIEVMPIDLKAASKISTGLVSKKAITEITDLASNNLKVLKAGGARTSFKALEIADNSKDLGIISVLATKFGKKSASILKVLGKKAYKLGKLLYLIGAIIIGIIGWLLYAAWLAFSATKGTVRLITRSGKRA